MKKTQEQVILQHLYTFGKISSWEAFQDYGITRLSAIIFNLRRDGLFIQNETKTTTTRLGNKTSYAEYRLIQ